MYKKFLCFVPKDAAERVKAMLSWDVLNGVSNHQWLVSDS